ncbi:frizzled and smoothened-like protein H [Oscarella lobularis]|uniref:frizzled and smoothened-like protein H n=1 Tax=Oscarella lobularis TaxID=121494 RepID=UPI003313CD30
MPSDEKSKPSKVKPAASMDFGDPIRTTVKMWENVLLIIGLFITLVLTAMPLVFYIWKPSSNDNPSNNETKAASIAYLRALNKSGCPWPSVHSSSKYAETMHCSPVCLSDEWVSSALTGGLLASISIASVFAIICFVVVVITWIKIKDLRRFPQIITPFMMGAFALPFIGFLLPLLMGRKNAFCNGYKDAFSMWEDPSPFCKAQGFLIHFGFVCSLTWWLCSIFNIFISLRCKTRPNPVRHHPKFLFVVEAVLSMGLPLVVTAIVLSTDAGYGTYSVEIITCGPASDNLMYFTFALPLQIITYIGSAMVIYILKETRQRFTGRVDDTQRRPSSLSASQEALRRRFILLVIALPISFSILMTTFGVYNKLTEPSLVDYFEYVVCLRLGGGDTCEAKHRTYGAIEMGIFNMFVFIFLSLALAAYALSPRVVRKYWKGRWRALLRCREFCSSDEYDLPDVFSGTMTPATKSTDLG